MAKEQVSSILRALEILECFMDNETNLQEHPKSKSRMAATMRQHLLHKISVSSSSHLPRNGIGFRFSRR